MKDSEVKNLEAIAKAIDQHNRNCPWPAVEVRMNPYEVDRLDWDTIRGLPVVADPDMPTGRFRIVCANEKESDDELVEAVSEEREVLTTA